MWKNNEIFRKSILVAKNHSARAEEGKKLLEDGKSLDNMQTSITGLTEEENIIRRRAYIDDLNGKSNSELKEMLRQVEAFIERRDDTEEKGTSELNWQRLVILEKLGQ